MSKLPCAQHTTGGRTHTHVVSCCHINLPSTITTPCVFLPSLSNVEQQQQQQQQRHLARCQMLSGENGIESESLAAAAAAPVVWCMSAVTSYTHRLCHVVRLLGGDVM